MIMVFGALLEFTFVNWLANKKIIGEPSLAFKLPLAVSLPLTGVGACHHPSPHFPQTLKVPSTPPLSLVMAVV